MTLHLNKSRYFEFAAKVTGHEVALYLEFRRLNYSLGVLIDFMKPFKQIRNLTLRYETSTVEVYRPGEL